MPLIHRYNSSNVQRLSLQVPTVRKVTNFSNTKLQMNINNSSFIGQILALEFVTLIAYGRKTNNFKDFL